MAMAPILPHMAEDININLPAAAGMGSEGEDGPSIFQRAFPKRLAEFPSHEPEVWSLVRAARDDANQVLEMARRDKVIGSSMEARITVGGAGGEVS